jgi:hypothetical protein
LTIMLVLSVSPTARKEMHVNNVLATRAKC